MRTRVIVAAVFFLAAGAAQASPLVAFGVGKGDVQMPRADDMSWGIGTSPQWSSPLGTLSWKIGGNTYNSLYVSNNGYISLGVSPPLGSWSPSSFPAGTPMIAPFWSDVYTTPLGSGTVWGGLFTSSSDAARSASIDALVNSTVNAGYSPYASNQNLVVTWDHVATYGTPLIFDTTAVSDGALARDTFQMILTSDGTQTFTFFNYETIQWLAGECSYVGSTCAGGAATKIALPAAGYDLGDGTSYTLPGTATQDTQFNLLGTAAGATLTSDLYSLPTKTNDGTAGQFVFRLAGSPVEPAHAVPEPATLSLLGLGLIALVRRRSRA